MSLLIILSAAIAVLSAIAETATLFILAFLGAPPVITQRYVGPDGQVLEGMIVRVFVVLLATWNGWRRTSNQPTSLWFGCGLIGASALWTYFIFKTWSGWTPALFGPASLGVAGYLEILDAQRAARPDRNANQ